MGLLNVKVGVLFEIRIRANFDYFYRHNEIFAILPKVSEGRKEMVYLTTHSTHFIYGYMALDI